MTALGDLSSPAVVRAQDEHHCIATWRNVYIVIWRHETQLPAVKSLASHLAQFAEVPAKGCTLLTIIEAGAPMPSADARSELARFMTSAANRLKSSAVAFEGAGFRAAAVRGVVTGLTMLARQPYPHKIFSTVPEAAQWLATSMPVTAQAPVEAAALITAVDGLRAQLAKR